MNKEQKVQVSDTTKLKNEIKLVSIIYKNIFAAAKA
ncbi:MAG: hypothetical protein JWQ30_2715 [Sediminibacterium sp.]|nr:hypothetical protein [Sediminibacterium sp.]